MNKSPNQISTNPNKKKSPSKAKALVIGVTALAGSLLLADRHADNVAETEARYIPTIEDEITKVGAEADDNVSDLAGVITVDPTEEAILTDKITDDIKKIQDGDSTLMPGTYVVYATDKDLNNHYIGVQKGQEKSFDFDVSADERVNVNE